MSRLAIQTDLVLQGRHWAIAPGHLPRSLPDLSRARVPGEPEAITATTTPPASAIGGGASGGGPGYSVQPGGVAVISILGTMTKWPMWPGCSCMSDFTSAVRKAAADPAVAAIVLYIESPGGTVAGTSDLADAVFAARRLKPVTAYASDLCASAAYYVASQADRIYADKDALVGSIGVYLVVPDCSKMAEQQGVRIHVVKAGAMKGAGAMGSKVTDQHLAEFQREVDQLNQVFVESVARGRGWSLERVRGLNDGRLHVGQNAAIVGLIDGVRSFDEVITSASKETRRPMPTARVGFIDPAAVDPTAWLNANGWAETVRTASAIYWARCGKIACQIPGGLALIDPERKDSIHLSGGATRSEYLSVRRT